MRAFRTVVICLLALLLLGAGAWVVRARRSGTKPFASAVGEESGAPRRRPTARIRVQVLNTTRTRALARHATRLLRDRGFDVVEMGTTSPQRDTTIVLDRSGHLEWATDVAKTLGARRIEVRLDSSRYLDVTVLLGSEWRPPVQPLYP